MAVTNTSDIDNVRESVGGKRIRQLKEQIAHLQTYKEDSDVGLLKRKLEQLEELHRKEIYNGN